MLLWGHLKLLPDLVTFVVSRAWTYCERLVLLWHVFDEELVGQPSRNADWRPAPLRVQQGEHLPKPGFAKFLAGTKEFILSTIVVVLFILFFVTSGTADPNRWDINVTTLFLCREAQVEK